MGKALLAAVLAAIVAILLMLRDPEASVNFSSVADQGYDISAVTAPRMAGIMLKLFSNVLHTSPIDHFLIQFLLDDNKFFKVRKFAAVTGEAPQFYPVYPVSVEQAEVHRKAAGHFNWDSFASQNHRIDDKSRTARFRRHTAWDYAAAYTSGTTTPSQVAERLLTAIKNSNERVPPLRAYIAVNEVEVRQQAALATERYKMKKPLGLFDGVPVAVKDEVDVKGYRSALGTSFLGLGAVAQEDTWTVSRLREAGAIIVGKTNMHEIGIGTTGHNAYWGCCRNAYNTSHYPGGSSSGSAAAVSAGLAVVAVGADGGGSIRIPAALNGVVGLKHTFGRESHRNVFHLDWTVGHIGPIAASVADTAAAYMIMSQPDVRDANVGLAPPAHLHGFDDTQDLSGLRIGVYSSYSNDSSFEVLRSCKAAVNALRERGAKIIEISIPHLDVMRLAHSATIISEMATVMGPFMREHLGDFSSETRINLGLARGLSAVDYVSSNQVRAFGIKTFNKIFNQVDVIAMPGTAITAPFIPADAVEGGESNLKQTTELMRFVFLGNLLGLPAIVVPVGQDRNALPVGLQLMGPAWSESTILRLAHAVEEFMTTSSEAMRKPEVFYDLLTSTKQ